MSFNSIDDRQVLNRSILSQIFPYVGSQTLDVLLSSINQDLTVPLNVTADNPADLTINVGPAIISNSESSRQKSIPFVGTSLPNSFAGTTVTFPSSSGGNITTGQGGSYPLTLPSGDYVAVLLALNNVGTVVITIGTPTASLPSVTVPAPSADTQAFSYVILSNVGGTIQNVAQDRIYQFVGGGTGGASSSAVPTVSILTYNETPFTAVVTNSSSTLTMVSNFTGLYVGLGLSGTDIAGGAYITALNPGGSTLTMSAPATGGAPTYASLVLQDITYTAVTPGPPGNSVTVSYTTGGAPVAASLVLQDITYTAVTAGSAGNSISVAYTTGGVAGSEVVTVISNSISVQIQSGVSTATDIYNAIIASAPASALVTPTITGTPSNTETAPASGNLSGGMDATVTVMVVGPAITVAIYSGVTTATQVYNAIIASAPATALVTPTITGTPSNTETAPASGNLSGGTYNTVTVTPTGGGTYVPPVGAIYLEIKMVGGGGGGGGNNNASGTNGTPTTFGTSLLSAGAGNAGSINIGGAGGINTIGVGVISVVNAPGGSGTSPSSGATGGGWTGGCGAPSPFGGAGGGNLTNGSNAADNSGSGGGGGVGPTTGNAGGSGGGSGGYIDVLIPNTSGNYIYSVGNGGTGGSGSNSNGGNGGTGIIIIKEYYN